MTTTNLGYPVDLPGGGRMYLFSPEEVELFELSSKRYQEDYALTKMNDLILVGAILTQQVIMFRAQQRVAGLEPGMDEGGHPTGEYRRVDKQKASDLSAAQNTVTKCAAEIRELEKALGIDKKTREAGGQHTVANYVEELKRAAHGYGVHIHERNLLYEETMMEARWKIRVLRNGDEEDRSYHDLTPEKFIEWLERKLAEIEVKDKEWAKDKGAIFVGRL